VGLPVDLLAKRGPLSALQVALRRRQKIRDPQTGSRNRKLTDRILRGPNGLRCVKLWSGYLQGLRRNFRINFENFKVTLISVPTRRFFFKLTTYIRNVVGYNIRKFYENRREEKKVKYP